MSWGITHLDLRGKLEKENHWFPFSENAKYLFKNRVLHFNYTLQLITITFYLKFTNYFTLICRTGYIGPLCVIAFFIVSTIFNKLLMSPVARRVFLQDRREGDLR